MNLIRTILWRSMINESQHVLKRYTDFFATDCIYLNSAAQVAAAWPPVRMNVTANRFYDMHRCLWPFTHFYKHGNQQLHKCAQMLCGQISRVICLSHGLLNFWGGVELYLSWNAPCVCLCFYVSEEEEVAPCQGVMWGTGRNDGMLICAFSTSSSSRSALSLLLLAHKRLEGIF